MRNALSTTHPELAGQWHPDLNGDLRPSEVSARSGAVVWWSCDATPPHVWQASIRSRAASGSGCPSCARSSRKLLRDHHPELAREWHPEKNLPLQLDDVGTGFGERVWWRCAEDPSHEWQAHVSTRIRQPVCPMCSGRIVTPKTSLAALYPYIAKEWHPDKNGALRPDEVGPGSSRRVWWRCSSNPAHEWECLVWSRARTKTGCPVCKGHALSPEVTLAAMYPELAGEWHPTRNGELTPDQVRAGSEQYAWWRCARDPSHEWRAMIASRRSHGCPMCSGRVATRATSLLALAPEAAREWHPTKNGKLKPSQVRPRAKKVVWWLCSTDPTHEWQAAPAAKTGCPICAGKKVIFSNSLAGFAPDVAREWHPTRNAGRKPEELYCYSISRVFWRCARDPRHEWEATVCARVRHGRGCPYCGGRAAGPTTSLAALHPEIAKDWHPERNGELTPETVVSGSATRVWWRCSANPAHEWQTRVCERTKRGAGCMMCFRERHRIELAERNRARARQW